MLLCSLFFALWMADDPVVTYGAPISKGDWAIQEDASKGIYDAVLIQDSTVFKANNTYYYRRIRILSESGKAAAEYFAPSGKVKALKGRVVDRNGKEVTFEKKEDFVKVLVFKTRGAKQKSRVLVPPGLTKDAVVEYSWRMEAEEGIEVGRYEKIYPIQSPYFVKEKSFEIRPNAFYSVGLITHFTSTPLKKPARYITEKKGKWSKVIYKDVMPLQEFPFGNRYLDQNTAYAMLYKSLPDYPSEAKGFWKKFSKELLGREIYGEKLSSSKEYNLWIKELKAGLPEAKHEALIYAYEAFRSKIKTPDLLTPTRLAQIEEDKDAARNVLRRAVSKGFVTYYDAGKVFYRIVKDLDIPAKMIFANSFDGMLFFPEHMRPFSFSFYYPFFGVKTEKGGWVIVSPLYQEYPPGYVPTDFQGAPALVVDPFNNWSHSLMRIPRFGPDEHQRITQYQSTLSEKGKMAIQLKRQKSGEYNAFAKSKYFPLPEDEREISLRNYWENRLTDMEVLKVSLDNGAALKGNMVEHVSAEGSIDAEHLNAFVISPFPGQLRPISSPSFWPGKRSQPIILPRCVNQIDVNVIQVPKGWTLMGDPSWKKANMVGQVRYAAIQKGEKITIRRDIQIKQDMLKASDEKELKSFIAWMTEAMNQRIGIAKGAGHE